MGSPEQKENLAWSNYPAHLLQLFGKTFIDYGIRSNKTITVITAAAITELIPGDGIFLLSNHGVDH
jgi:hypothetical protein